MTKVKTTLEIHNLKKVFKSKKTEIRAVDGINLSIDNNEIVGLVGESGSGKSTLGKMITGLVDKTEGVIKYQNRELPSRYSIRDYRTQATEIQMIFQDPYSSLNPRMTVGEIVGEGLHTVKKMKKNDISENVALWLKRVGLKTEYMSRYPHEFSGGQRQRIGIARALIMEPKLLICDEPISALDVSVQAQVINLLSDLKTRMDLTILFIAHDLSMVRYISNRMAVMYKGKIVEIGDSDQVFFSPKHPYTELLIDSIPNTNFRFPSINAETDSTSLSDTGINSIGCSFADRCSKVKDICKTKAPSLTKLTGSDQIVSCHLYLR